MYVRDDPGLRMADMAAEDRPRERMLRHGPNHLSDRELMAILLGKGRKGEDVLELASRILDQIDRSGGVPKMEKLMEELMAVKGVGPAKAAVVTAALEFARRRIRPEGERIRSPSDVLPLIRHIADRKQEHLLAITLNGANEVIAVRVITVGLLNRTQVHPREVFADAVADRAAALILAHNHPSGSVEPSADDRAVTRRIHEAGEVLGISLLDHLIFARRGYFSFKEAGEI
ncbi:MAG: RadC family protein [Desulfococcaceae bacterium]